MRQPPMRAGFENRRAMIVRRARARQPAAPDTGNGNEPPNGNGGNGGNGNG